MLAWRLVPSAGETTESEWLTMLRVKDGHVLHPHSTILVSFDNGKTWDERHFCGNSHCTGKCGYPALTAMGQRARGSMVAMGMVFERIREWTGERVEVPTELQERALKMWWN